MTEKFDDSEVLAPRLKEFYWKLDVTVWGWTAGLWVFCSFRREEMFGPVWALPLSRELLRSGRGGAYFCWRFSLCISPLRWFHEDALLKVVVLWLINVVLVFYCWWFSNSVCVWLMFRGRSWTLFNEMEIIFWRQVLRLFLGHLFCFFWRGGSLCFC